MLIPLGTNRPLARPTLVTFGLIIANVAVFGTGQVLARTDEAAAESLSELLALDPLHFRWWGLFTYAFVHADLMHLLGNMLFLWVFGPAVEDRFGRLWYLLFYLAGGAAAGGFHVCFEYASVVGASGAVAAVTGAFLVLFPRTEVRALFLIFLGLFSFPSWWFIGGRIVWDLYSTGTRMSGNVATGAHLAGYAFGGTLSLILLWLRIIPREVYDLFSLSRQAARRRHFREAQFQAQKAAARPLAAEPRSEELAKSRAEVLDRLAEIDAPGLAGAYRKLLESFGEEQALLSRKAQYDAANLIYRAGDHQTAATAYRLFHKGYPADPELPQVCLMLGIINARYLNDPVQAKKDVARALEGLRPGQERDLAQELMAELG